MISKRPWKVNSSEKTGVKQGETNPSIFPLPQCYSRVSSPFSICPPAGLASVPRQGYFGDGYASFGHRLGFSVGWSAGMLSASAEESNSANGTSLIGGDAATFLV